MHVKISEVYDPSTKAQVATLCRQKFGNAVIVSDQLPSFGFEIGTISSVAGLIVSLVSLWLYLRDRKPTGSSAVKDDEREAAEHVQSQLLQLGLDTATEVSFHSYRALDELEGKACSVTIKSQQPLHKVTVNVSYTTETCSFSPE